MMIKYHAVYKERRIFMGYLLKNATVFTDNEFKKTDIFIEDNIIVSVGAGCYKDSVSFDFNNLFIFPGFTDVHVHLREP